MIDYTLPLDQLPDPLPIEPLVKPFDVTITPPGSKSITCRAYVLAALAEGESKIIRPLRADDTDHILKALCTLGAEARWDGDDVYIKGVAGRFPRGGNLYMGEGGTPTRFMIACACLAKEPVVIDASPRMRERPIAEGVDMLRQLGAKIEYVEAEGRLPVRVLPSDKFSGGEIEVGLTQSSQFVSALLLIAPFLERGLRIRYSDRVTSPSYVRMTHDVMHRYRLKTETLFFGDDSAKEERIKHQRIRGGELRIPPDASSCAYWFVAAEVAPFSRTQVPELFFQSDGALKMIVSEQPDAGVLLAFPVDHWQFHDDIIGLRSGDTRPSLDLNASTMPDGAIALATYAANADGPSRLTGLRTLRVKETDRIAALANELRKVGCSVETGDDWISITPPPEKHAGSDRREDPDRRGHAADRSGSSSLRSSDPASPVIIETYNDHRMAMAFAVLGLVRPGISIRNPKCVAKSYPGFWKDFAKLYQ